MNEIEKDEDQLVSASCQQAANEAEERKILEASYYRRGTWDARVWFSVATEQEIEYHWGISTLDEMAIDGFFCYMGIEAYSPLVPADEPANQYFYVVFESDEAFSYEQYYDCETGDEFFIPNDLYRAWFRGWVTMFRKLLDERQKQNQTD